jgi:hypothetical protein
VLALACAYAVSARPGDAVAKEPPLPPIPLRFRVARARADAPAGVVNDVFIASQLAESNRLFAPHGISFIEATTAREPVGSEHARLEDAKARDALAAFIQRGVLDVFFVAFLRDVDDPVLERMGVTWRMRSDLAKRYVIVSAVAREATLAHELGHVLGNGHTAVLNNLMSYERDGGPVSLDTAQGAKSRRTARDLFARRVLDGPGATR